MISLLLIFLFRTFPYSCTCVMRWFFERFVCFNLIGFSHRHCKRFWFVMINHRHPFLCRSSFSRLCKVPFPDRCVSFSIPSDVNAKLLPQLGTNQPQEAALQRERRKWSDCDETPGDQSRHGESHHLEAWRNAEAVLAVQKLTSVIYWWICTDQR